MTPVEFITKWKVAQGREDSNSNPFLNDLCHALNLPSPGPWTGDFLSSGYIYEAPVNVTDADGTHSTKKIDLYRRDCFILEAKQGTDESAEASLELVAGTTPKKRASRSASVRKNTSRIIRGRPGWRRYIDDAKKQAEEYARQLPDSEHIPPIIIVSDIGYLFEFYHNFRDTARSYEPLPIWNRSHSLRLEDLADPAVRDIFQRVWNSPRSLDPTARQTVVTRDLAQKLGKLAAEFDKDRRLEPDTAPSADTVADFLIRCLFTMYAEDVGLLPEKSFTNLLMEIKEDPRQVSDSLTALWREMNEGGYSATLRRRIPRFNGRVFANATAIPINTTRMDRLIEAARCDWSDVDPSIFGSLLENALDARQRSAQGAHYTPRAYVERLVRATIEDPLRDEWELVQSKAIADDEAGHRAASVLDCHQFLHRLATLRILDPACGTGNFLVVAYERLKTLEAEVLRFLRLNLEDRTPLGDTHTVKTTQFLGLEVNPRAARIAELVVNLSALQWFYRNRQNPDEHPPEPVIREGKSIECRDAVLTWSDKKPLFDEMSRPRTRWDGFTMKVDAVTGRSVPDDSARVLIETYSNPRPAEWPQADFIVGNPPFIAAKYFRDRLSDGYAEAIWKAYPEIPNSADFVMYWWHKAAIAVRTGRTRRFGLITTNSITQTFSRRVMEIHLKDNDPLSLIMAIPDHPWTEGDKSAAVRISMTVVVKGVFKGELKEVDHEINNENPGEGYQIRFKDIIGVINSDLTVGVDLAELKSLKANDGMACKGMTLIGKGFVLNNSELLSLTRSEHNKSIIRPYRNGRDINGKPRKLYVIDTFGLDELKLQVDFPEIYQWLYTRVYPERTAKKDNTKDAQSYAKTWWLFGKNRAELRRSLIDLKIYIVTVETAKHRIFQFLDASILPDNKLIVMASADAYLLGVLSSSYHTTFSISSGGWLGHGNDPVYSKLKCFDTFPFPDATEAQKAKIREIGERLDAHRKRQQSLHADLTLTEMYNALEAVRSGVNLQETDSKGKKIHAKLIKSHETGLVSILKKHHDDLDTAVAEAYGWPTNLPDQEILQRLVNLNTHRHQEEQGGLIRWLRPEYQCNTIQKADK